MSHCRAWFSGDHDTVQVDTDYAIVVICNTCEGFWIETGWDPRRWRFTKSIEEAADLISPCPKAMRRFAIALAGR